jgi:hypothetical protein
VRNITSFFQAICQVFSFEEIFSNSKNHNILEKMSLCEANANFSKKIEMLFLSFEKSTNTKTRMNSRVTVSQKSVEKQVLVNNLGLIPDLANVIKEFAFYDKVSQVSRNLKNVLIAGLDESFEPGFGYYFTEGFGVVFDGGYVRYRQSGIQLLDFNGNFQFVTCYSCGGYIHSNAPIIAHNALCSCNVINLIENGDDDEDEDQDDEGFELHYQEDDEDMYNGNDYEYS